MVRLDDDFFPMAACSRIGGAEKMVTEVQMKSRITKNADCSSVLAGTTSLKHSNNVI